MMRTEQNVVSSYSQMNNDKQNVNVQHIECKAFIFYSFLVQNRQKQEEDLLFLYFAFDWFGPKQYN